MTTPTPNIAALSQGIRPDVVSAIRQASAQTGVDFNYLLEKAAAESSFDPKAQAETSSARGLYQFVDRTWLETMDRHGAAHGYPNVAAAITRDADGNPVVANAAAQEYILALRDNPRISALMAAELAQDNAAMLEHSLGRGVDNTELYMAHFLGAGGAAKFINEMEANGDVEARYIVPAAARANAAVFYDEGTALTLDQVFARFRGKFGGEPDGPIGVREPVATMQTATDAQAADAAIVAAFDPSFAALQALHRSPERAPTASLRSELAAQLFTLSLLQAFEQGDEDGSREWLA